mgnify:CR=1 FL=1
MVKWQYSYHYFRDKGHDTRIEVAKFASKYNCIYDYVNSTIACREADFVVIMLQCPNAVGRVYGNVEA